RIGRTIEQQEVAPVEPSEQKAIAPVPVAPPVTPGPAVAEAEVVEMEPAPAIVVTPAPVDKAPVGDGNEKKSAGVADEAAPVSRPEPKAETPEPKAETNVTPFPTTGESTLPPPPDDPGVDPDEDEEAKAATRFRL